MHTARWVYRSTSHLPATVTVQNNTDAAHNLCRAIIFININNVMLLLYYSIIPEV